MADDWQARAACAGTGDAMFVTGAAQHDAAKVCRSCPVWRECREYALEAGEEFGVWGGLTERQRRAIRTRA